MKKIFSYFIFLSLLFLFNIYQVEAREIAAPTVLKIGEKISSEGKNEFFVKGLSEEDTDVLIYINGAFADLAKVQSEGTGADNYYFESILDKDNFEVKVIARDKKTHILSPPTIESYQVPAPPAPTIIFPSENETLVDSKVNIIGLSKSNTIVEFYVDGKLVGETDYLTHPSGTANFSYSSEILSPGKHDLYLKSKDSLNRESKASKELSYKIIHPMPAPILFEPVVNNNTTNGKPFIVGLAKNNSNIKIFIDNKYEGNFLVENDVSGTANFAYQPKKELTRGSHLIYATATDYSGKESKRSNIEGYEFRQPMIAEAVQEENKSIVAETIEQNKKEDNPIVLSENNEDEIKDLNLNYNKEDNSQVKDDVDESLHENIQKTSKIDKNLIIFLAFLFGIIIWIIWVNRELVKEQKETEKNQNKTNLDNDNI